MREWNKTMIPGTSSEPTIDTQEHSVETRFANAKNSSVLPTSLQIPMQKMPFEAELSLNSRLPIQIWLSPPIHQPTRVSATSTDRSSAFQS
jgi:hypothetical protein